MDQDRFRANGTTPERPPHRLQLGVGRLEELSVDVLDTFLDKSWLHLGDAEPGEVSHDLSYYLDLLRRRPIRFLRSAAGRVLGLHAVSNRPRVDPAELYRRTHFQGFRFGKGGRLPFEDDSFDFIFSEHFLHHLFLDEACSLLRECRRILAPHGVIRTVVPDADLRTYARPEPLGYPDVRMRFDVPMKHKTRYSVYMLEETLRLNGLVPVALHYCDRHGDYIRKDLSGLRDVYRDCPEREMIFDLSYVMRPNSLIVDGMKIPAS